MEGEVCIKINYNKFNADVSWDGVKAYPTNTSLTKQKIINSKGNAEGAFIAYPHSL